MGAFSSCNQEVFVENVWWKVNCFSMFGSMFNFLICEWTDWLTDWRWSIKMEWNICCWWSLQFFAQEPDNEKLSLNFPRLGVVCESYCSRMFWEGCELNLLWSMCLYRSHHPAYKCTMVHFPRIFYIMGQNRREQVPSGMLYHTILNWKQNNLWT